MNLLTIALRNSRRKPLRTLLLLFLFTLGVASVVSLWHVSRVVGHSLEEKLTAYGANILLTPRSESLSVSYGGFHLGDLQYAVRSLDEEQVERAVRSIELHERISAVAPKLVVLERIRNEPVGLIGVRWDRELDIKSWWSVRGGYPGDPSQVLAGSAAAARFGLGPGDRLDIKGRAFTVAGVLEPTGGDDDKVLFLDLGALQRAADRPGQVSFVEVAALCAGCPIEDITAQIAAALPDVQVGALRSVVRQRMFFIDFVNRLVLGVGLVILVTGCAMVGLSMLSAVNERRKEIGILRSLGFSRARVFGVFCCEALVVGAGAGLMGYGLGFGASFRVLRALDMKQAGTPAFEPAHFAWAVAGVALISVLSAAAPALKASRIEPAEVLASL